MNGVMEGESFLSAPSLQSFTQSVDVDEAWAYWGKSGMREGDMGLLRTGVTDERSGLAIAPSRTV